jgi:hypothetical protein
MAPNATQVRASPRAVRLVFAPASPLSYPTEQPQGIVDLARMLPARAKNHFPIDGLIASDIHRWHRAAERRHHAVGGANPGGPEVRIPHRPILRTGLVSSRIVGATERTEVAADRSSRPVVERGPMSMQRVPLTPTREINRRRTPRQPVSKSQPTPPKPTNPRDDRRPLPRKHRRATAKR